MKTFILHWLDGKDDIIYGDDIAHAVNRSGYGQGALPALDYWEEIPSEQDIKPVDQTADTKPFLDVDLDALHPAVRKLIEE